jgi:hypothetical protein
MHNNSQQVFEFKMINIREQKGLLNDSLTSRIIKPKEKQITINRRHVHARKFIYKSHHQLHKFHSTREQGMMKESKSFELALSFSKFCALALDISFHVLSHTY